MNIFLTFALLGTTLQMWQEKWWINVNVMGHIAGKPTGEQGRNQVHATGTIINRGLVTLWLLKEEKTSHPKRTDTARLSSCVFSDLFKTGSSPSFPQNWLLLPIFLTQFPPYIFCSGVNKSLLKAISPKIKGQWNNYKKLVIFYSMCTVLLYLNTIRIRWKKSLSALSKKKFDQQELVRLMLPQALSQADTYLSIKWLIIKHFAEWLLLLLYVSGGLSIYS